MENATKTAIIAAVIAAIPGTYALTYQSAQNQKIDSQIFISQANIAGQFSAQVPDLLAKIEMQSATNCLDMEKLKKTAKFVRDLAYARCWKDLMILPFRPQYRYEWLAKQKELAGDEDHASRLRTKAKNAAFWGLSNIPLDRGIGMDDESSVVADSNISSLAEIVTNGLIPYRQIIDAPADQYQAETPQLSNRPYSRERGLILKQFLKYGIRPVGNYSFSLIDEASIKFSDASGLNLTGALIKCSMIQDVDFRFINFSRGAVQDTLFVSSDLSSSDWTGATIVGTTFINTVMPSAEDFRIHSVRNVTFKDAVIATRDWPQIVEKQIREFSARSVTVTWDEQRKSYLMTSVPTLGPRPTISNWRRNCENFNRFDLRLIEADVEVK